MSNKNCDQTGNDSGNLSKGPGVPDPNKEDVLKPENNMPEKRSQKDGLDYIAPVEKTTKRYRALGSFVRQAAKDEEDLYLPDGQVIKNEQDLDQPVKKSGKDEAEPEMPDVRPEKDDAQINDTSQSEEKLSVDVSSPDERDNKELNEIGIKPDAPTKDSREVVAPESESKQDQELNLGSYREIKLPDGVVISYNRQTKQSTLDLNIEHAKKRGNEFQDTNEHVKKDPIEKEVRGEDGFVKEDENIGARAPDKNLKIDNENTIDATAALKSPKEWEEYFLSNLKSEKKSEDDVPVDDYHEEKEEEEFPATSSESKVEEEVDAAPEGDEKIEEEIPESSHEEKSEEEIDNAPSVEKDEEEISRAPQGKEKSEKEISNTSPTSKELEEIENAEVVSEKDSPEIDDTDPTEKGEEEVEDTQVAAEKDGPEIDDTESTEKGEEEIDEILPGTSKPYPADITGETISSIDKNSISLSDSIALQQTNISYDVSTPDSGQIVENDYDVSIGQRNKDAADDEQAKNGKTTYNALNVNFIGEDGKIINGTISNSRYLKTSSDEKTSESFASIDVSSDGVIHEEIYNTDKFYSDDINVLDMKHGENSPTIFNDNINYDEFSSPRTLHTFTQSSDQLVQSTLKQPGNSATNAIGVNAEDQDEWIISNINTNYYEDAGQDSVDVLTGNRSDIKIDGTTGENILYDNYEAEYAEEASSIMVHTSPSEDSTYQRPAGQGKTNFNYSPIATFNSREAYTSFITPDSSGAEESFQRINVHNFKLTGDSEIVSTINDKSEESTYNGQYQPLLDDDGNTVGYAYNNQESTNFSYDNIWLDSIDQKAPRSYDESYDNSNLITGITVTGKMPESENASSSVDVTDPRFDQDDGLINYYDDENDFLTTRNKDEIETWSGLTSTVTATSSGKEHGKDDYVVTDSDDILSYSNSDDATMPTLSSLANENFSYNISAYGMRTSASNIITSPETEDGEITSRLPIGIQGYKSSISTDVVVTTNDDIGVSTTHEGEFQLIYNDAGEIIGSTYNNQEQSRFQYNISSFGDRPNYSEIITSPETEEGEAITRQRLGRYGIKGEVIISAVNTIDDDGSESSYNGLSQPIYDESGEIIDYTYYNQESSNFNYYGTIINEVTSQEITVDNLTTHQFDNSGNRLAALKNRAYPSAIEEGGEFDIAQFRIDGENFGANDYQFTQFTSTTDVNTDNTGLSASRDIKTSNDLSFLKQLGLNTMSSAGITDTLSAISSSVNNMQDLIESFSTEGFFDINYDYNNVLRRTLTTELPSVLFSFKQGFDIQGGESPHIIEGIFDSLGIASDVLETSGNMLNHPGAVIANAIRGDSSVVDLLDGGDGEVDLNILTQGTSGQHGGINGVLGLSGSSRFKNYDINDSLATGSDYWNQGDGNGLFAEFASSGEDLYNKNIIRKYIDDNLRQIKNKTSRIASNLGISEAAVETSLISSYEAIEEKQLDGRGSDHVLVDRLNLESRDGREDSLRKIAVNQRIYNIDDIGSWFSNESITSSSRLIHEKKIEDYSQDVSINGKTINFAGENQLTYGENQWLLLPSNAQQGVNFDAQYNVTTEGVLSSISSVESYSSSSDFYRELMFDSSTDEGGAKVLYQPNISGNNDPEDPHLLEVESTTRMFSGPDNREGKDFFFNNFETLSDGSRRLFNIDNLNITASVNTLGDDALNITSPTPQGADELVSRISNVEYNEDGLYINLNNYTEGYDFLYLNPENGQYGSPLGDANISTNYKLEDGTQYSGKDTAFRALQSQADGLDYNLLNYFESSNSVNTDDPASTSPGDFTNIFSMQNVVKDSGSHPNQDILGSLFDVEIPNMDLFNQIHYNSNGVVYTGNNVDASGGLIDPHRSVDFDITPSNFNGGQNNGAMALGKDAYHKFVADEETVYSLSNQLGVTSQNNISVLSSMKDESLNSDLFESFTSSFKDDQGNPRSKFINYYSGLTSASTTQSAMGDPHTISQTNSSINVSRQGRDLFIDALLEGNQTNPFNLDNEKVYSWSQPRLVTGSDNYYDILNSEERSPSILQNEDLLTTEDYFTPSSMQDGFNVVDFKYRAKLTTETMSGPRPVAPLDKFRFAGSGSSFVSSINGIGQDQDAGNIIVDYSNSNVDGEPILSTAPTLNYYLNFIQQDDGARPASRYPISMYDGNPNIRVGSFGTITINKDKNNLTKIEAFGIVSANLDDNKFVDSDLGIVRQGGEIDFSERERTAFKREIKPQFHSDQQFIEYEKDERGRATGVISETTLQHASFVFNGEDVDNDNRNNYEEALVYRGGADSEESLNMTTRSSYHAKIRDKFSKLLDPAHGGQKTGNTNDMGCGYLVIIKSPAKTVDDEDNVVYHIPMQFNPEITGESRTANWSQQTAIGRTNEHFIWSNTASRTIQFKTTYAVIAPSDDSPEWFIDENNKNIIYDSWGTHWNEQNVSSILNKYRGLLLPRGYTTAKTNADALDGNKLSPPIISLVFGTDTMSQFSDSPKKSFSNWIATDLNIDPRLEVGYTNARNPRMYDITMTLKEIAPSWRSYQIHEHLGV